MSFLDMVEARNNAKISLTESEAPIPGKVNIQSTNIVTPKKLKYNVKYYVGNMDDPADRAFISDIMTRSFASSLVDKESVGDIIVLGEESNWTKEGMYLIAIKYMEAIEDQA